MTARDTDARVARTNARLESMAAVLIDVVGTRGEVDCTKNLVVGCGYTATDSLSSSDSTQYGKRTFRHGQCHD